MERKFLERGMKKSKKKKQTDIGAFKEKRF